MFNQTNMKKTILICSTIFMSIAMYSCTEKSENGKLIQGNWQGTEWLINGQSSNRNVDGTSFSFDDKGNYTFNYGATKEAGTYKVENDMLFTTPEKQSEIMVKIMKLTKDSLVFDMNRGGQPETLTLLKK